MEVRLDPVEARVLGALIEKEITTPDYYPMTLNALVSACNQKSNRHPVVTFGEDAVLDALDRLRPKKLVLKMVSSGSRADKYAHRLSEVWNLGRREAALLCVLLLRGPQTPGELRDRTERMHAFEDLAGVESCLRRLEEEPLKLVTQLPRQPGTKELRWAHLLSGEVKLEEMRAERPSSLEAEVAELRERVEELSRQFAEFRSQFE